MAGGEQRIDKWLFFARVVKSRSLAQKLAVSGAVRLNREKVAHSARTVRPGDVLTISINDRIRVLRILDPGLRRGPASEAATLFEDLSAPREAPGMVDGADTAIEGFAPGPRPDRRERREAMRLRNPDGEDA